MTKTILITGATDGIGLETAKLLAAAGHTLLLHGRSEAKLASAAEAVARVAGAGDIKTYCADLSALADVNALAESVKADVKQLDVLINNAGVFMVPEPLTATGHDLRFVVNVFAPYALTKQLLPAIGREGRVVNLSSAAQAPVEIDALTGGRRLSDSLAYAQSKLALTMWTVEMAQLQAGDGPAYIAVNPASFLGSKMVKEAYGRAGQDLRIGADILIRASLSDEFAGASGRYFDNDRGQFADPHPDAMNAAKRREVVEAIEQTIASLNGA